MTRPGSEADVTGKINDVGGGARWGGHDGSAMCFVIFTDHSTLMSNDGEVVLIEPTSAPIIYTSRTSLQRSSAVWGAVKPEVATVLVTDMIHVKGVGAALTIGHATTAKFFVEPVGAGPITITALDADGKTVATATVS